MFTAIVRVMGAGRMQDFQERVRWLMVRDIDAEAYTEHHGEHGLEYHFEPRSGVPFPVFVQASADFPELRVEATWETDAVKGRVVIEAGRLSERDIEKKDG